MADSHLSSVEEFVASLKYFFFLFKRQFTPSLEQAARAQWQSLSAGDATVKEDGQNNPLVELRLDPAFGTAICAALADSGGNLPSLRIPQTPQQLEFWQARAAGTMFPQASVELSEITSHFETIREALTWHVSSAMAVGAGPVPPGQPLRVCLLGASARYEYAAGVSGVEDLTERLAAVVESAAPGRPAEFVLCGRDVPAQFHGKVSTSRSGLVVTRHHMGYLHDLPAEASSLSGVLFIALHSGIGLDHPELSTSWPPTLQKLRSAAPAWLVVSSFNVVEHEAAERALRLGLLSQLAVDTSGVNRVGSLHGPEVVGPFDGIQGKRNYCVLHARISASPTQQQGEEWDIFD
mmetsp:Transcript_86819/g.218555  ORF Transcript_86819/g.218555 Transcript_86819/m.218555 type:complete len:350 (+) Transcript_86819:65-1114(+)